MSQDLPMSEAIELIQEARSASQSRDRQGFARAAEKFMWPDCEWIPLIGGVEGRSYRGPDGALAFFDDFHAAFEVRYGKTEYRPVEQSAVIELTTMHVRGRQSDVAVERELGVLYELQGGRLRRAFAYDSHARALAKAEELHAAA